jgi:hypothetical protein
MRRLPLFLALCGPSVLTLALCGALRPSPRYVVTPAGRGIYRTDTKTGEVYLYTPAGFRKIEDRLPTE